VPIDTDGASLRSVTQTNTPAANNPSGIAVFDIAAFELEGLQTRDNEPPGRSPHIDQLLGGKPRPRTQVGEVTFHRARTNAHELGRIRDRSAGRNEGSEDVLLVRGRWKGE
jgi:hypothetical protein